MHLSAHAVTASTMIADFESERQDEVSQAATVEKEAVRGKCHYGQYW